MFKQKFLRVLYKCVLKPMLFLLDAEKAHNLLTNIGEYIGSNKATSIVISLACSYSNTKLHQEIYGINFNNPVGLAAGFDYDGHLAATMKNVGFGFNTIGTVTAKPYEGNIPPRLGRLPKSKSLLVNKGFKSDGVDAVIKRLDSKDLNSVTIGVSVGSSNIPEVNSISKAIDDYIESFEKLKKKKYIKYFELNISCPNAAMNESFGQKHNFKALLNELSKLDIKKPILVKMANESSLNETDRLVKLGINMGISGFIFSNLVKKRTNNTLNKQEIENIKHLKGNFSGKPTQENSDRLIKHIHKEYGKHTLIIGCGGVFSAQDAYQKIKLGASLVQLITGMIYEGPQLISEINEDLVKLLKRDGYQNISEAIGTAN